MSSIFYPATGKLLRSAQVPVNVVPIGTLHMFTRFPTPGRIIVDGCWGTLACMSSETELNIFTLA